LFRPSLSGGIYHRRRSDGRIYDPQPTFTHRVTFPAPSPHLRLKSIRRSPRRQRVQRQPVLQRRKRSAPTIRPVAQPARQPNPHPRPVQIQPVRIDNLGGIRQRAPHRHHMDRPRFPLSRHSGREAQIRRTIRQFRNLHLHRPRPRERRMHHPPGTRPAKPSEGVSKPAR
jgi:hypothetical protein